MDSTTPAIGQQMVVRGIAAPLVWDVAPVQASAQDGTLHITAGKETDLFRDPQGQVEKSNSPRLLFGPDPQFTLSARVRVDFDGTYDAGVLMVYVSDASWAKLCFELSPQGQPMVVTVVTNGYLRRLQLHRDRRWSGLSAYQRTWHRLCLSLFAGRHALESGALFRAPRSARCQDRFLITGSGWRWVFGAL